MFSGYFNHWDLPVCFKMTGARWPKFRPNNSKKAPNYYLWPEKIGGREIAEFGKKVAKKRPKNIFRNI
jgi:hypothetical protein